MRNKKLRKSKKHAYREEGPIKKQILANNLRQKFRQKHGVEDEKRSKFYILHFFIRGHHLSLKNEEKLILRGPTADIMLTSAGARTVSLRKPEHDFALSQQIATSAQFLSAPANWGRCFSSPPCKLLRWQRESASRGHLILCSKLYGAGGQITVMPSYLFSFCKEPVGPLLVFSTFQGQTADQGKDQGFNPYLSIIFNKQKVVFYSFRG